MIHSQEPVSHTAHPAMGSKRMDITSKDLNSIPISRRCSPHLAVWSRALLAWGFVIKCINLCGSKTTSLETVPVLQSHFC